MLGLLMSLKGMGGWMGLVKAVALTGGFTLGDTGDALVFYYHPREGGVPCSWHLGVEPEKWEVSDSVRDSFAHKNLPPWCGWGRG